LRNSHGAFDKFLPAQPTNLYEQMLFASLSAKASVVRDPNDLPDRGIKYTSQYESRMPSVGVELAPD